MVTRYTDQCEHRGLLGNLLELKEILIAVHYTETEKKQRKTYLISNYSQSVKCKSFINNLQ